MITILTAALLDFDALKKTAASIFPILDEDVKWLVKLSMEATPEIRALLNVEHVAVVERPDKCLYEGLNQGLEQITTPFFFVLPAGDELVTENFPAVKELLRSGQSEINVLFNSLRLKSTGKILHSDPSQLSVRMSCPHPSSILRTSAAREFGGFDTRYEIAADYDLLSRFVNRYTITHTSKILFVDYEGGGISQLRFFEGFLEEELIRQRVWKVGVLRSCLSIRTTVENILVRVAQDH